MIEIVSILLLGSFAMACLICLPAWRRNFKSINKRLRVAYWIWFLLAIGSGVFFEKVGKTQLGGLDTSAKMQIISYAIAGVLTVITFMNYSSGNLSMKPPVIALFFYGLLALISTIYAPSALITLYKASVIILDVVAVAAVMKLMIKYNRPSLIFDVAVMTAILFTVGAFFSVLIRPDAAMRPIYGGGAFGFILDGAFPYMNGNELGFLSAVVTLVSASRLFNPAHQSPKLFWAACGFVGLAGMMFAQARTALVGVSIGLFILAIAIPSLRKFAVAFGVLGGGLVLIMIFVGQANVDVSGNVGNFLAKGQGEGGLQSFEGRYHAWATLGVKMIMASPIVGHGFETGLLYGGEEFGISGHMHMHNSHVQILINSGMVGYLCWLVVVMWTLLKFTQIIKRNLGKRARLQSDPRMFEIYAVYVLLMLRTITGSVMINHGVTLIFLLGTIVYILCSERMRITVARKAMTTGM